MDAKYELARKLILDKHLDPQAVYAVLDELPENEPTPSAKAHQRIWRADFNPDNPSHTSKMWRKLSSIAEGKPYRLTTILGHLALSQSEASQKAVDQWLGDSKFKVGYLDHPPPNSTFTRFEQKLEVGHKVA
jgi:hypothetical protein